MMVGSLSGGLIIPWGRRKTILLFNVVGIIAVVLSLALNLYTIIIGKLLFGICTGVINVAYPKMLDETVPLHLLGAFGIATNAYICFGIFLTMLMGAGLPEDGDIEGYEQDEFWRIIYGSAIPFCVLMLIAFTVFVRKDSIVYSI